MPVYYIIKSFSFLKIITLIIISFKSASGGAGAGGSGSYVDNSQASLANLPLSMDPVLCKDFIF